ncbi:metallophosphoesterase [Botrimarina hoheduenensis]|uniref:Phosphodiesterase YaeI n=1 Tax=Botrimarina hoheduenensis TaxID=2528000 RepID=A0A5C5WEP8_9BACT|nr:metallophosphoesterase [Botrimarina hoheduenensis]TWT48549.1 phosphodiesterase YaeI [Botrimarina hoheduenensis]
MPSTVWLVAALLGHGALGVEAVNRLHGLGIRRSWVDALTAACGAAMIGLPVVAAWQLLSAGSLGAALETYGWVAIAALVLIAVSRGLLRWDPHRDSSANRPTSVETLDLAAALGEAATGPPLVRAASRLPGNQLLRVAVEHRVIGLERLPAAWQDLRIAHLTDLHMSGRLGIDYFHALVKRVNAWEPDFVFLTGDLVEHTPQLEWVAPVFGALRPRVAGHFILGNHDEKVDCPALRRQLVAAGLVDAGTTPVRYGPPYEGLVICGDERPWFPTVASPPRGIATLTVCLAHTPDRFGSAVAAGIDLVLAGHCHGGQVCFPLVGPLLCPSRHGVRYAAGTFRRGRTVMHVGRGTGSLFPLRYGCPPELSLITLRTEQSVATA